MVRRMGSPKPAFSVGGRKLGRMDHWPNDISYTCYINGSGVAKYMSQIFGFALVLSSTVPNICEQNAITVNTG